MTAARMLIIYSLKAALALLDKQIKSLAADCGPALLPVFIL
ncbi:hypothetical protein [Kamptonema formosum]|nr:hypothetical protein [Oscillatoria sp. PCC 10802]